MRLWIAIILLAGCAATPAQGPDPVAPGLALACDGGAADACNVKVAGPSVNEFSVAAHPHDRQTVIVTANDYAGGSVALPGGMQASPHSLWGSIWTSHDGGATWMHQYVPGKLDEPGSPLWGQEFVGDLVVTYAPGGVAYIAGIAYASTGTPHHKLFVMSSPDGDAWSDPVVVDAPAAGLEFHDKPALLATSTGRLVLVWNYGGGYPPREPLAQEGDDMRWAISDDGGATWTAGTFDDAGSGISASLAEAPDGTIHAVYRTYDPLGIMHRSSPDGMAWSQETLVSPIGTSSIETNGTGYRTFVLPDLAITPDGRLHAIVADKDEDLSGRILVATSTDGGDTWDVQRIDGGGEGTGRFLAAIGQDNGTLVAAWLDARQGDAYGLWMAVNDGSGWAEQRVSAAPSPPGDAFFIGDYIDVDVRAGTAYVAWPDLRDGATDLYAARLTLAPLAA